MNNSQQIRLNGVMDFLRRLRLGDDCLPESHLWERVLQNILKEVFSSTHNRHLMVDKEIAAKPARKAFGRKGGNHKKRHSALTRKRISKALKASHKRKKATGKKWQEGTPP